MSPSPSCIKSWRDLLTRDLVASDTDAATLCTALMYEYITTFFMSKSKITLFLLG